MGARILVLSMVVATLALLVRPGAATAQANNEAMRGIPGGFVIVEDLSQDAQICGLKQLVLERNLGGLLSKRGFKLFDKRSFEYPVAYLVIDSLFFETNALCVSFVRLSLSRYALIDYLGASRFVETVFWKGAGVFSSVAVHHPDKIDSALESIAARLIEDWASVQSKAPAKP